MPLKIGLKDTDSVRSVVVNTERPDYTQRPKIASICFLSCLKMLCMM